MEKVVITHYEKKDNWADQVFIRVFTNENGVRMFQIRGETITMHMNDHIYYGWAKLRYMCPSLVVELNKVCEWDPCWFVLKSIEEYRKTKRIYAKDNPQEIFDYANKTVLGDGNGSVKIAAYEIDLDMEDGYYVMDL